MKLKSLQTKLLSFALAIGVFFAIYLAPLPEQILNNGHTIALNFEGKTVLATLAFAVILWITEVIPFPVTGLYALVVLVLTKVVTLKQVVQDSFGDPIILFFIGVLIFSAAFSDTILLRRLTTIMRYRLGHKPKLLVLAILTMGMLLSGGMVEMAVAAIMLPIGMSILKDAKIEPLKSNFGRALMIACAWGPATGGICTPVGSGTNPLTIGFMHDLAGINFTFLDWMAFGYPAAFMMLPFAWLILIKIFPFEEVDLKITKEDFHERLRLIGPVNQKEVFLVVIFVFTMIMWIHSAMDRKMERWKHILSKHLVYCYCIFLSAVPSWYRSYDLEKGRKFNFMGQCDSDCHRTGIGNGALQNWWCGMAGMDHV